MPGVSACSFHRCLRLRTPLVVASTLVLRHHLRLVRCSGRSNGGGGGRGGSSEEGGLKMSAQGSVGGRHGGRDKRQYAQQHAEGNAAEAVDLLGALRGA